MKYDIDTCYALIGRANEILTRTGATFKITPCFQYGRFGADKQDERGAVTLFETTTKRELCLQLKAYILGLLQVEQYRSK